MTTDPPEMLYERRRNPSRRRALVDVKYWVVWQEARRTFVVYRDDVRKQASASDQATAIALAVLEAQQEPRELKIAVMSIRDGKPTVEWSR
jgi:hypothetical protein